VVSEENDEEREGGIFSSEAKGDMELFGGEVASSSVSSSLI
jgi:hypothetical protein